MVRTLSDTTSQMDRMVKRFREQKEMVIVKLRTDLNEVVHGAMLKGWRERGRIEISEEYGEPSASLVRCNVDRERNADHRRKRDRCDAGKGTVGC